MGMGQSFNTFTPFIMPQINFGGFPAASTSTSETEEEAKKRRKKEEADKAAAEFDKQLEIIKNNMLQKEKEYMEAPLTKKEKEALQKEGLKLEELEIKKSEGTLAASMLFTTPFLLPKIKAAINPKKNTIEMFYKDGASHMGLFSKNPDLMTNAQESMQKLEQKFLNDFKAAKGNRALIKDIADERNFFRDTMKKALESNNPMEIAKATEQCNVAKSVKNGRFSRLFRWFKKQPNIKSRYDAVMTADNAGKFGSVKPPKTGNSFIRNIFSNKTTWIMTAMMAIVPVVMDWGNIQKASAVDKENAQNGKNTNYGTKQIMQTGIKGIATALTYNLTDTLVRTVTKKCIGKIAASLATKIAINGGCKILGSAVGSIVPGIGTALGIIAGSAADFLLNKYVLGKMDFFKNSSIKEAELSSSSDEQLLSQISEQYSMGNKINKKVVDLLRRKFGSENFSRLQEMHNMSEEERNAYIAKISQEQQQLQEQQAQQQQGQQPQEVAYA